MIRLGYIKSEGDHHYYYTYVDGKLSPQVYVGAEGMMKKILIDNKCAAMLILIEEFIQADAAIIDPGKNVHSYTEFVDRLKKYVSWGHSNKDTLPESVIDNGRVCADRYLEPMIGMISKEHPERQKLIFLHHSVTLLHAEPYNI